jgi:hypothetical protein
VTDVHAGGARVPRRALLLAAVTYGTLALAAQRSLLPGLRDRVYQQDLLGNDCLLHVWTLAWDHHALTTDPDRLFDANIFYPHDDTLLYSDHLLGIALLLAPLRALTANVVLAHNAVTVAAPALDALALYALAYELTGLPAAALAGGLLYGFAPVRFTAERCQIQMLAAWWLPLVLLFARRALVENRVRPGLAAGAALALQGLTGIYLTAFLLPFLALAHVVWLRRFPLRPHRRGWAALVGAEAGAVAVLLPFALAYRSVQESLGVARSTVLNALLSLDLARLDDNLPLFSLAGLVVAGLVARRPPAAFRAERPLLVAITLGALLLALGPSVQLPAGLGQVRGPYAALLAVPGYDALRVPARFTHLVLLGASVIAAGGFAVLVRRLSARGRAAAFVAVLAGLVVEGRYPGFATIPAPPPLARDPVYGWMAEQPGELPFVEIPIDDYDQSAVRYQYASTAHWKRSAGGSTGIGPPVYFWLRHKLRRFPDTDVVASLRALGVTHAVVHLPARAARRLLALGRDPTSPLALRWARRNTLAYAIRDDLPDVRPRLAGRPLDRARWRATASHAARLAGLAIDADPATYWNSWGDLDDALHAWYDPLPLRERWRRFTDSLPVGLDVDLGETVALTAVVVRLGGSDPMVAPTLRVETSRDGTVWTALPGDLDPVPDARALVTHAAEARFALVPPAPTPARFVRVSGKGLELHVGDVAIHHAD